MRDQIQKTLGQLWQEEDGVLSFEWSLLGVLLVFGIVGGLSAVRDGVISELADSAQAILRIDQSYSFAGFGVGPGSIPPSQFTDTLGTVTQCTRGGVAGQGTVGPTP